MNKILIHHNNTSFNTTALFSLSDQFVFDVDSDKDIDLYIDENLKDGQLRKLIEQADILFIKVSLSHNYLEYFGIRLAYHIRLTKSLHDKANLPIVFIAEETLQFLGLTYQEPTILFTKGIYLIKENIADFNKVLRWYEEGHIKQLDDPEIFINNIKINPPANYQSHHSIANEWALIRYFSMFKEEEENKKYVEIRNKICNLDYVKTLHYKYSEALINRQLFNQKKHQEEPVNIHHVQGKRIGLIDDEADKGWGAYFDYWLDNSGAEIVICDKFHKNLNKEDLLIQIKNWIDAQIACDSACDIFIIDLRLLENDFSEDNFKNLTGIKIADFIKKKNPGIQLIILTASNKIWNFQSCLDLGIKSFAIKESPEYNNSRSETKDFVVHLSKEISKASTSSYLAGLYRQIAYLKQNHIFKLSNTLKERDFSSLVFDTNGLIDQIFNLLVLDDKKDTIINQCLILCFQILEQYCDIPTIGDFGSHSQKKIASGYIWKKDGSKFDVFTSQDEMMSTMFNLKNGIFPFQIDKGRETVVSATFYNEKSLVSSHRGGLDSSSLVKIISVLKYRDQISNEDIDKIIALRFYRSNVVAHLTGEVKMSYKINAVDICHILNLIVRIFLKS
ncbi:MAG: hypothetical protein PHT07_22855 [Paludibacter sp.]|nr:hypothetical protein [Paludibacter sp.]